MSALEPHEDTNHVDARRFASELVTYLEQHRQAHRFDRLFVIAPPKFLGVLRDSWTPSLKRLIQDEVDLELTTLTDAELQQRLEKVVAATMA